MSDYSIIRNISIYLIDKYYAELIKNLNLAAELCVPRYSSSARSAEKHWWTEELEDLKSRSMDAHRLWKEAGRPRTGPIFEIYKKEKFTYKIAIKHAKNEAADSITNDLHDALIQKDDSQFWKLWNSRFGSDRSGSQPQQVGGLLDSAEISEAFAKYFSDICRPNSEETNALLRSKFEEKFINYVGDGIDSNDFFSVELVCKLICERKTGKAAGLDKISTEHLLHCHPLVYVYLTYLFNLMLLTGYVPLEFGIGVIFPIPKGNVNQKVVSFDDFRGITVSPVISKILEKGILERFGYCMGSSDSQFGFKKRVGCSHAIYTLNSVVSYFVDNGSTVNICSLDLAKAFDRSNHLLYFLN